MIRLRKRGNHISFSVRVKTKSRISGILGEQGRAFSIGVREAPEKGKANKALIKLLAESLGARKGDISIVRGQTSRDKVIEVFDSTGEIERRINSVSSEKGGGSGEPLGKD